MAPPRLYVLAGHELHVGCPVRFWAVPGAHATHVDPTGAPTAELAVPTEQSVQLVAPNAVWYDPAGQYEHATYDVAYGSVPKVPGAHCWHATWPLCEL